MFFSVRAAALSMSVAVLLAGCAITPTDRIYDSTPRHPTTQVQVVRGDLDRPYTVIAQLTTKANTDTGETAIDALVRKAKALGADAVMLNPPRTDTPNLPSNMEVGPASPETTPTSSSAPNGITAWVVAFKKP